MRKLSIGKIRGLQQCSSQGGKFSILALDHRNNLRRLLHPENPKDTTADEMAGFKIDVVHALSGETSAFLLDPLYGAAQSITAQALEGNTGLLVAIEKSGYAGDPTSRSSELLKDWNVTKIKRMGASAVKLLVYYHPESPTHKEIENIVEDIAEECEKTDIAFFLEILTYSLNPEQRKLISNERKEIILESARNLTELGVDVLKAEFPIDFIETIEYSHWEVACAQLTEASRSPWILLSASVTFETFLRQVNAACAGGASGVAVGRAVWKEAVELVGEQRKIFLNDVAKIRMRKVSNLVNALAIPWTQYYGHETISDSWYSNYKK